MTRFLPFLPGRHHERITISLPYSDDNLIFINPMGEKVNHPDSPNGHPGFDFSWNRNVEIIASAEGRVSNIKIHEGFDPGHTIWDGEVVTGDYAIRYTELESYVVKKGQYIKRGELIGHPGSYSGGGRTHYGMTILASIIHYLLGKLKRS